MKHRDETLRLRRHAGLPSADTARTSDASICKEVHSWIRKGGELDLRALTFDVISCLEAINERTYSETAKRMETAVDTETAYAVGQLVAELLQGVERLRASSDTRVEPLLLAVRMISHAWAQLLAGDIPDLRLDLEHHGLGFD